jgi:hypothetical protein
MLRILSRTLLFVFFTGLGVDLAFTNGGGAPDGHTGAPGESNCTDCHSSFTVNSGTATRSFVLNGDPNLTAYVPGQVYTVSYTITQSGITKFGFSAVAKRSNGNSAGSFIATSPTQTQLSGNYITHTAGGTAASSAGQKVWNFSWTAPAAGAGTVTFYVAGNATNADNSSSGDRIYTNSYAFTEAASPATIAAATFNPAVICRGGQLVVNFSTTGTFNSGNIFTVQLSNAAGSFASPTNIGTLTATTAAAINATIPVSATGGTGYKVRVVSSNPVVTGNESTQLTITVPATAPSLSYDGRLLTASGSGPFIWARNGNTISGVSGNTYQPTQTGAYTAAVANNGCSPSISSAVNVAGGFLQFTAPLIVCPGNVYATNPGVFGTFDANNVFTVELSDQQGSFSNPQVIGSESGATVGSLSATFPHGITLGTGYRIRLKATSPLAISDTSAVITANSTPALPSIQQNGFVLTSSAPSGNQWFRNGQLLANETGTTLTVTQNGRYQVMVTIAGCSSDTSFAVNINNVSVYDPVLETVQLYPNPVSDWWYVEMESPVTIEIRDIQGRLFKQWQPQAGNQSYDLSDLAAGMYMVTLKRGDALRFEKLIKQ